MWLLLNNINLLKVGLLKTFLSSYNAQYYFLPWCFQFSSLWHMSCKPFFILLRCTAIIGICESFSYSQYFLSQQLFDRPICFHLSNCLVFWSIRVDSHCNQLPLSNFSFVCTLQHLRWDQGKDLIKNIYSRSDFQFLTLGPS